jgi:hypothetical protein
MPALIKLPAERLLVLRPGAASSLRFVVSGGDLQPFAFAGYGARAMIRQKKTDPSPLLSLTAGNGITLGASDGSILVVITAAQSLSLRALYTGDARAQPQRTLFSGVWDCWLDPSGTPDGTSFPVLAGPVTIDLPVTR